MPVYEYRCRDCEKEFEVIETFEEHDAHEVSDVRCPECDSNHVERVWSHVVAVTSKKS